MIKWRKSSRSGNQGNCVEVGNTDAETLVRDTKQNGKGPVLSFSPDAWKAFLESLKK